MARRQRLGPPFKGAEIEREFRHFIGAGDGVVPPEEILKQFGKYADRVSTRHQGDNPYDSNARARVKRMEGMLNSVRSSEGEPR